MIEEGQGSNRPPHWLLLPLAIGIMLMIPAVIGEGGEAVKEAFSELLGPIGLLLVPLILVFTIRFLSSDWGSSVSSIFATGESGISRGTSGSLVSKLLFSILVLVLLYSKVSIFGGDSSE